MIGKIEKIENEDKESHLESGSYYTIVAWHPIQKRYMNIFMTFKDLEKFLIREEKNKEDCTTPSWWKRLCHWLMG